MLVFNYKITVGDKEVLKFSTVRIESTWQHIADTCEIEIPDLKEQLKNAFKPGDPVKVELGYDGKLNTEFVGYVRAVHPNQPYRLECEDEAWKLKRETVSLSWKSTTLPEVIATLVPEADVSQLQSVKLEPFVINKATKYQALQLLKDEYG